MSFTSTHPLLPPISATLQEPGSKLDSHLKTTTTTLLSPHGPTGRIKQMFHKIELSVSAYDTAWVAMLPSLNSHDAPRFPQCLSWVLHNQLTDGSWSLPHRPPSLLKDALSSTLACILALKKWGVGEQLINQGLQFIELNSTSITDGKLHTPIGFDIIFPGMIELAKGLNLNLPLKSAEVDAMLNRRDMEIQSCSGSNLEGRKAYLAYVSEGIGKLQNWEMVMKYKRKNGSLFNSPSATAAALSHLHDDDCLCYLDSLVKKFGNAVPTVYPIDMYARLSMVDTLETLGIDRYFRSEIKVALDEIYRCWLQGEEEIFLDSVTCSMAFRILRIHGYDVSSDLLTQCVEDFYFNSLGGYLKNVVAALELYRASQIAFPYDSSLEELNLWSSHFLKLELTSGTIHADRPIETVAREVHHALKFPYHADLDRLVHRRSIEQCNAECTRILKSSYCCSNFGSEDFLKLAEEDFNACQSMHKEELEHLARWVAEARLDKLQFARQKLSHCYFSAAATLFAPELSDARISWAKNGVLTTVVDDFFDVGGSQEELENFVLLIEKWDINGSIGFCSEKVQIIFSAVYDSVCEIADKAFPRQGRDVTSHVVEIWLDLVKSMLKEAQWLREMATPTVDEYMANAYISCALGPLVLPALYLVGPKLSEEAVGASEYHNLYKVMSTCGRLLNDWRTFERESQEGKLNALSLLIIHGGGAVTEEEAIAKMKPLIDTYRVQLRQLVLQEKGNAIPSPCRKLFWNMIKVLHMFYMKDDGFTANEMIDAAHAVIKTPISLNKI